jgi:hypothetical protein
MLFGCSSLISGTEEGCGKNEYALIAIKKNLLMMKKLHVKDGIKKDKQQKN